MQHTTNRSGREITPVVDRTPTRRRNQSPVRATPNGVAQRNSHFTPAARAFPTAPTVHYADTRYISPRVETVVKKVMRSEYASLVIVLLVMLAVFSTLFVLALTLGWF